MKRKTLLMGASSGGIPAAIMKALLHAGHDVLGVVAPGELSTIKTQEDSEHLTLIEVNIADRIPLNAFLATLKTTQLQAIINAQMFFKMELGSPFNQEDWDKTIAVNLTAPNLVVRGLGDNLVDGGAIISITSTEGFSGSFGSSGYSATKAAIHNLTKSWANIYGPRKIRANAIAAGWIGGVMDTDEVFNLSKKITPLGRLGSPEEIADIVMLLLSDRTSFINGQTIVADGGYTGVDTISKFEYEASAKS